MLEQLNDVIVEQMTKWTIPGVSISSYRDGKAETSSYGIANTETGVAVTADTLFQIGSISKIFTTTLTMTFVDEGRIDLDLPVIDYLPDLVLTDGTARETITIRHLLTHMAGFYGDRFDDHGNGDDALARKIAAFYDLRQQTGVGELWTYCNAGFDLTGRILELVGEGSFEDLMRKRVFDPLGLTTTTYFASEAILHAVAVGHEDNEALDAVRIATPWPIPRCSNPAGGISSTTAQLLRFAQMHMNDGEIDGTRVISAKSAQEMRSFQTNAGPHATWGVGWARQTIGDQELVGHGGATNGFTAKLLLYPARNFALAILTNHSRGSSAYPVIEKVALDRFFGLKSQDGPIVELPAAKLQELAGTYGHDLGSLELTLRADGFAVIPTRRNPFDDKRTPGLPFRLRPVSDTVFLADGGGNDGAYADFHFNPDGSVRFLRMFGRLGYPLP